MFLVLGLLLGAVSVVLMNRIPGSWLADYGENGPSVGERYPKVRTFLAGTVLLTGEGDLLVRNGPEVCGHTVAAMGLLWLFWLIALADGKYGILPDAFTGGVLCLGVFWNHVSVSVPGILLLGGGAFLLGSITERRTGEPWIGFGDVKLLAVLGAVFGVRGGITAVCLSSLGAGGVALLFWLCGRLRLADGIPYGPFLAMGGSACLLGITLDG